MRLQTEFNVKSAFAFIAIAFLLLLRAVHLPAAGVELKGNVSLSGAWAIYPTAVALAEEFKLKYPGVNVDVAAGGAGKGAADCIAGLVDIGMVSRDPDPAELAKGVTPIYVLHDAVYAVINERNPFLAYIQKTGAAKKALAQVYISGEAKKWSAIAGESADQQIHVYTRSDSCGAAATWAKYFDKKQEDLKGVGIYGDPGIIEAVKKDPLGIGYANFSFVFTREGKTLPGIVLLPLEKGGDASYTDKADAIKAIRAGKYPVSRKNWFFVKNKLNPAAREFIRFALSDEGMNIVEKVGASLPITSDERIKVLKELEAVK